MTNFSETTKVFFYFLLGSFLVASQVFADVCDDAFVDFATEVSIIVEKKTITSADTDLFNKQLNNLKFNIQNEECYQSTMKMTLEYSEAFKKKRIETLNKYKQMGIKEEGGKDVAGELNYLLGLGQSNQATGSTRVQSPVAVVLKKNEVLIPKVSGKCGDVILENDAVNLNNVRDQDTVGWCYSYIAADLISYRLNQKISAVSLYDSGQDIEDDIGTPGLGGDVGLSLQNYLKKNKGLCLEEELPSTDFKFCTDQVYNDFLVKLVTTIKGQKLEAELETNQCFGQDIERAFPGVSISFIRNYSANHGSHKLIESLYNLQCKKLVAKNMTVHYRTLVKSETSVSDMLKSIDEQLSNGNLPSIVYDYNKLNKEPETSSHGSIVVGRRTNPETGKCDYLLRNSYGKSCDQNEDSELSCHKTCDASGCRYTGNFWVSQDRVKEVITGVTYLK